MSEIFQTFVKLTRDFMSFSIRSCPEKEFASEHKWSIRTILQCIRLCSLIRWKFAHGNWGNLHLDFQVIHLPGRTTEIVGLDG